MRKSRSSLIGMVLWGFGLSAVSWGSGYSVRGSVGQVSWEIATMLTPAGMVQVLSRPDHWLRRYYFQNVVVGGFFGNPMLVSLFFIFAVFSLWGLMLLRRGLSDSR